MRLTAILIACVSGNAVAFVVLWFWVVGRELRAKQEIVQAARCQLITGKQAYMRARGGPQEKQSQEILERCEHIYSQAVQHYCETLHQPQNRLPAFFLGFRQEEKTNQAGRNQ